MVQAKITLKDNGPKSLRVRGYKLEQGRTVLSTNPADIRYFQGVAKVDVQIVSGDMPKAVPQIDPRKRKAAEDAGVPIIEGDEETGEGEEVEEDGGAADGLYKLSDLKKQTRAALAELGESEFGLQLDPNGKKGDLIDEILKAQEASEGEEDEDGEEAEEDDGEEELADGEE